MIAVCRHCSKSKVNRPRGLCWSCYYTPGVKDQYPSTSKYARRGVGNFSGNAPLPDAPTTAAPGSPEKLAVLEQRAKLRQAIFHPADARYAGDPRPLAPEKKQGAHAPRSPRRPALTPDCHRGPRPGVRRAGRRGVSGRAGPGAAGRTRSGGRVSPQAES